MSIPVILGERSSTFQVTRKLSRDGRPPSFLTSRKKSRRYWSLRRYLVRSTPDSRGDKCRVGGSTGSWEHLRAPRPQEKVYSVLFISLGPLRTFQPTGPPCRSTDTTPLRSPLQILHRVGTLNLHNPRESESKERKFSPNHYRRNVIILFLGHTCVKTWTQFTSRPRVSAQ